VERLTKDRLAQLLRDAEAAHGGYEVQLGHRDEDWPSWYAGYIVEQLEDEPRDIKPGPGSTSS
jgi:hypothetical protein